MKQESQAAPNLNLGPTIDIFYFCSFLTVAPEIFACLSLGLGLAVEILG